jgi:hypothetical protein
MKLRSTSLCLDCEELYEGLRCPLCASEASAYLNHWIPSHDGIRVEATDGPGASLQASDGHHRGAALAERASEANRRRGPDRRRHARGGRRPEDRSGHAPLVFVVSRDAATREFCEQQLLDRRFAVVPCDGAGPAVETLRALRPDVVVTDLREAAVLRDRALAGRYGTGTPIVEFAGTIRSIDAVLEDIRRALRSQQVTGH